MKYPPPVPLLQGASNSQPWVELTSETQIDYVTETLPKDGCGYTMKITSLVNLFCNVLPVWVAAFFDGKGEDGKDQLIKSYQKASQEYSNIYPTANSKPSVFGYFHN
jgi:hypothetical protein